MVQLHSHAFALPPPPTWLPLPANATPIFTRYRPDETTVKALSLTQCELHLLRTAHNRLSEQTRRDKQDWDNQRTELEEQLMQMLVRSSEAERLFNDQMSELMSLLESKRDRLQQMELEHDQLRGASAGAIQALQQRLEDLQGSCDALQERKARLQQELHDAGVSVELGRRAQQRAAELESAIDATRERAKQMLSSMQKERDEAEGQRDVLQQRLQSTQASLQQQAELRGVSEQQALRLAIERQRLSNALEVERLINAPLRNTDHATTTLAHVMRSAAAPTIAGHSTTPRSTSYLSPPPPASSLSNDAVTVSWSGPQGPATRTVRRPQVATSFAERELTLLGRSWATTTPTAGLPNPTFADNVPRFREVYSSGPMAHAGSARAATRQQQGGNSSGAATSAQAVPAAGSGAASPPAAAPVPFGSVFLTPPRKAGVQQEDFRASLSSSEISTGGRTERY